MQLQALATVFVCARVYTHLNLVRIHVGQIDRANLERRVRQHCLVQSGGVIEMVVVHLARDVAPMADAGPARPAHSRRARLISARATSGAQASPRRREHVAIGAAIEHVQRPAAAYGAHEQTWLALADVVKLKCGEEICRDELS
jgi:hypothetical protein